MGSILMDYHASVKTVKNFPCQILHYMVHPCMHACKCHLMYCFSLDKKIENSMAVPEIRPRRTSREQRDQPNVKCVAIVHGHDNANIVYISSNVCNEDSSTSILYFFLILAGMTGIRPKEMLLSL